jgi:hypothetical protein
MFEAVDWQNKLHPVVESASAASADGTPCYAQFALQLSQVLSKL